MKLKKLLKEIPVQQIKGSKEIEITGICSNSKLVAPGNLFIAKKGITTNGAQFIPEAISAGAAAILTDIFDPTQKNIVQIIHPNPGSIEGSIAAAYNQHPSDELLMVGITGTNGKTTSSYMIKHLLDQLYEGPAGLIGTIEYIIGNHRHPATRTTPEVCSNQKMLREMLTQGCRSCVMEVTSHALDQGRVDNIHFDVGIYTNLSLDHLDYHNTMEEYGNVKNRLFTSLDPKKVKKKRRTHQIAIVNADCEWADHVTKNCAVEKIWYGIEKEADLRASEIEMSAKGTTVNLHYKGEAVVCRWPYIGRYNCYNCLAAIALGLSQGKSLENVAEAMAKLPPVPGRLEPVANELGLNVYVDFAHSDDALSNVLKSLRELTDGKVIVLFGCGGDRDKTKRPKMAAVCEQYADLTIVTTDNPRSEDPETIIREIIQGFQSTDHYLIETDRRQAIEKALSIATDRDIVLLAGKGHEPYQVFAHQTIEFDDRVVAQEVMQNLGVVNP